MNHENEDFNEMIIHLEGVIERSGKGSISGKSAARQIKKIKTIRKIRREAKLIQERIKKGYDHIAEKTRA